MMVIKSEGEEVIEGIVSFLLLLLEYERKEYMYMVKEI